MRKFIVKHSKGETAVQEVDVVKLTALEDVSITWLPENEFRAKVISPASFYEKNDDGSLSPPVWCTHAFYDSEAEALARAEKDIRGEMERIAWKTQIEFDIIVCLEKIKQIKIYYLA